MSNLIILYILNKLSAWKVDVPAFLFLMELSHGILNSGKNCKEDKKNVIVNVLEGAIVDTMLKFLSQKLEERVLYLFIHLQ